MLPDERPCLLLLPVPALEHLPAGRLYLIPGHSVLVHHIIVDRLSLLVAQPHFSAPSIVTSTEMPVQFGCVNMYAVTHCGICSHVKSCQCRQWFPSGK